MLQSMGSQRVRHDLLTEQQQLYTHTRTHTHTRTYLIAQVVKNPPAVQEILVQFLGWEDLLEKGQATHSSIFWLHLCLSWQRNHLQCGRPGFDLWVGKIPWRRERLPTPVFWPGEFHRPYNPWGCKESDVTFTFSRVGIHCIGKEKTFINKSQEFLLDTERCKIWELWLQGSFH